MPTLTGRDVKRALVVWGDEKRRRSLFKILSANGAEVSFETSSLDVSALADDYALLVIDYDTAREDFSRILSAVAELPRRPAVLVMTSSGAREDLASLVSQPVLTNLFVKNVDVVASELLVTVRKILKNDVFGMEKYMTWGVEPRETFIRHSSQKAEAVEEMGAYLVRLNCNRRLIELAKAVADELLMNVIYNAPTTPAGKAKYSGRSRAEPVALSADEEAIFRYTCDGRDLAISVEDSFGTLSRETVLSYLYKCLSGGENQIDAKAGGSGLGLYYMFESLNHLIINVAPGARTEMIGILNVSGTYRDFAEKSKSINLFFEESR